MKSHTYENPLLVTPSRPLPRSVAIVGAGTIGPDIGYYLKSNVPNLELVLVDVAQEALDRAMERINRTAQKGVAKKKLTEEQAASVVEKIVPTLDYGEMKRCDWVIEAATENLALKRKIFAQIEDVVGEDALITSNTSSLPASRLFTELKHKQRATVTHFFAPAYQNPAVEVIRWSEVEPAVVEWLRWVFAATGKVPMVTDDAICFMLDRVFDNWCNEAAYLLEHATASEIDSVASKYVYAGPFQVLNLAHGNPIIVETNTLQMEEGAHYLPAEIFKSVEAWHTIAPGKRAEVDEDKTGRISDRLLGILFSQSFDIVDRTIGTLSDLNLGCAVALGFKKGPLDLMRDLGNEEVGRIVSRLQKERPGMPGPRQEVGAYQRFHRHLLVDEVDGVVVITLRRPQALNALDDQVTDELLATIREHDEKDDVVGFVIVGYGERAFSAGADIGRFPEVLGRADDAAEYARDCSRLLVHLDQMKKPVVAALNGMALGGGLELALRCHSIVARRSAWLQLPEVTLGIAPGIGGMVVPYRRWPKAAGTFHEMIRTARKLKAEKAYELGVLDGLADGYDTLIKLAVGRVTELAGNVARIPNGPVEIAPVSGEAPDPSRLSPRVVEIIDRAISDAAGASSLEEALEIGYRAFAETACTAAAKEGVTAFLERRKPDFTKTG